ncbi:hypothetical protein D3C81_1216810 [compost metagenome]
MHAHLHEAIAVQQDGRGAAEIHHVGDGIELHAELRTGVRQARDIAVERIEHAGQHQQCRRQAVGIRVAHGGVIDGNDDAGKTACYRKQSHHAGQGVFGALQARLGQCIQMYGQSK